MSTPIKLTIVPGSLNKRGQFYSVLLGDEVLVPLSLDPEHAACRALVAKGFTGPAEFWRQGADHPRMLIRDIERAAKFSVSEAEAHGPKLTRYQPFPVASFNGVTKRDDSEADEREEAAKVTVSSPGEKTDAPPLG